MITEKLEHIRRMIRDLVKVEGSDALVRQEGIAELYIDTFEREATKALREENERWRYFAWALCPHIGKYGDDGEMQCHGADFKRGERENLNQHVVIALREWRQRAESATKALREEMGATKNLLAVLHRDGGHHTEEVGFVQSCKDGEQVRHRLMEENGRLRDEVGRWVDASGVSYPRYLAKTLDYREKQAESANRALVEALREARGWIGLVGGYEKALGIMDAALAAHEGRTKAEGGKT